MTGAELKRVLGRAMVELEGSAEELRALDAAVGDGDLGITVSAGAAAIRAAIAELGEETTVAAVMLAAAKAFANANPSTMAALVASGLLRGAKAADGDSVDLDGAVRIGRAAFDGIAQRGKAAPGDKTVLDALGPSVDALQAAANAGADAGEALGAAIAAARQGVEETTALANRKGRASWLGERSAGNPDPGATAYLRFLEAWERAMRENHG